MGAPLAWAGLSRTVIVVAVSFRKASWPSYSSIVGAEKRIWGCISVALTSCCLNVILKILSQQHILKCIFSTWNISCHIERGCRTKPFRGRCSYRQLVCDTWVELRKHVMGGVWRQWHCEPWSLQRHRRVKRMHATVADLSWSRESETIFFFYLFIFFQRIAVLSLASTTAANDSTSYCIMTPLGSVGSFQERLIVSSDGVALSDWLGTGPGTVNTHKFMQF